MAEALLNAGPDPHRTERVTRRTHDSGFTLIEMMMTVTVFAIVLGAAVPGLTDLTGSMRLRQGLREVERELQAARLKAVSSNRPIRVRFNCPAAGSYRMVELIGTPGVPDDADDADDRCSDVAYPHPAADANRLTLPNHDGPVRQLHPSLAFGAADALEFRPDGSVHQADLDATPWPAVTSDGVSITVRKGDLVGAITVNGLGKIQLQ
ncbi:MAG: prepilin-type N-terminal cleavage/methylation domain-containing protein [Acidimicrobiia bacterium]|nr:prepilin-type N-terminal cleavage/methylation domain-containing protein [Acidimicrobiia bacterium]